MSEEMRAVVEWLRSPDGESWSRNRMELARKDAYVDPDGEPFDDPAVTQYQSRGTGDYVRGFFSVKWDGGGQPWEVSFSSAASSSS